LNENGGHPLLKDFHWIIIPIFNIDGYVYTHQSTNTRLWRKNRQPNTGSNCVGTDVNRNYAYMWGGAGASADPCSDTFRGARAFSSPEANSEHRFLQPLYQAGNLISYIDIHSYGGYFLSSWGYTNNLPPNYQQMLATMTTGVAAIRAVNGNSYLYGPSGRTLYTTSGSTVDEIFGMGGVVQSYTIECSGNNFTPPISAIRPIGAEVWAGVRSVATDLAKTRNVLI